MEVIKPDLNSGVRVLHAQVVELEERIVPLEEQLHALKILTAKQRFLIDVLEPIARLYVAAFADDERTTPVERLRLQEAKNALKILEEEARV